MDRKRIDELVPIYRDGLLDDTIPWWQSRFIDEEHGGFLTYRDADGSLLSTDKPVWVLGRIIWMWSRLYNDVEKRDDWLAVAQHGLDFMQRHAFDADGRMFWLLTRDGRPLRKRRYLFTETFGAIALAELAQATGSDELRHRAHQLFCLILRYHRTPGLLEPKVMPQTRRLKSHAMPMILLATSQVMRRVNDDPLYDQTIEQSLQEVLGDFVKPEKKCLLENVQPDGTMPDTPEGRTVLPGHAIETAWFIMEEARRRNDAALVGSATQILEWSLDFGWDTEHGGILYYVDCDGKPAEPYEHELKLWWPHNEALYACLLAHHLTGDDKWAAWYERVHDWAFAHFPDRAHGEWYGYLRRDGTVSCPVKGNLWKGPFHLPRMQLYCWKLLEQMRASESGG